MLKFLSSRRNQLIIIAALTVLAYLNIFGNQFVIDDRTFIVDWKTKNNFDMVAFFKGDLPPGHEGVYRPIRSVFYAFYYAIFGESPLGYHLHSIAVHLASTGLVYLMVKKITTDLLQISTDKNKRKEVSLKTNNLTSKLNGLASQAQRSGHLNLNPTTVFVPFVAALLFGLHPIHTETISYISSAMEAVGITFALGAFYLYLLGKKYYWWSVAAAVAAFFTHEITLVLPVLIVLYEWTLGRGTERQRDRVYKVDKGSKSSISLYPLSTLSLRPFVTKYLPYFAGAGVYVIIRFLILNIGARGPYLADSVWLTFLTMIKAMFKYLTILILPVNLASNHVLSPGIEAFVYRDYRTEGIRAQSLFDSDILIYLAILFVIIIGAFAARKKYPIITFSILWFFISLLPVLEIVPQGSVLNEKNLYLASFGLVLLAAYAFGEFFKKGFEYIAFSVLILLCGFYLASTYARNRDWHDDISIWSSDVRLHPEDNAYAYFQLGNAYAGRGMVEPAIDNYLKSYQINPGFVVSLASVGKVYNDIGRQDLAIDFYRKSLEVNPGFWEGYLNLANIYFRRADFDLAKEQYENILKVAPGFTQVEENLKNLPEIREATRAGKPDENVWLKYHRVGGLALTLPSVWQVRPGFNKLTTLDEKGEFEANFVISRRDAKESFEDYLKEQTKTYGKLVNEGLALIPNFDKAYVKVWEEEEGTKGQRDKVEENIEGQKKTILQFFLFREDKVIEIVVSPGNSPQMQNFDLVLGSTKIE